MIGYKLFRERKDGTLGPLFINRTQKLSLGVWYRAEEHRTKGFAFRPGWHICGSPRAPHLTMRENRAWYEVEFCKIDEVERPLSQGGVWYLGSSMKVLRKL